MKNIFVTLLFIGISNICISQRFTGIYTEYKRTLLSGEDGSNFTYNQKPFKLSMQFEFKANENKVTVYNGDKQSEQIYVITGDTLTFEMKIGEGENIRAIYTEYIITENKNELILKEFKASLDEKFYLKKFYFKKGNSLQQDLLKKVDYDIFSLVNEMPSFPGGPDEMKKFIANEVGKTNLKGEEKVFIKLLINPEGKIEDVDILNKPKLEYVQEAIKIIRKLPNFTPGKLNGKPVFVYYNLPVKFNK